MPKVGRTIGAILTFIGGGLIIYAAVLIFEWMSVSHDAIVTFTLTLIMGIVAVDGGTLLLQDKKLGGIQAIIVGVVIFIGFWIEIGPSIPLAVHWASLSGIGFFIDPLLVIIGGILGLVVGKAE